MVSGRKETLAASLHAGEPDWTSASGSLVVGISGARRSAAVAAVVDGRLEGFCEQERLTRVRSVGLQAGRLPDDALNAVLGIVDRRAADVRTFVVAEDDARVPAHLPHEQIDHHLAHAATAALTSPFERAAVLVCDEHSTPPVTVWSYDRGRLTGRAWPWPGRDFASLYSECAREFGFGSGSEHRLEALARLDGGGDAIDLSRWIAYRDGSLSVDPTWKAAVTHKLSDSGPLRDLGRAAARAHAFQRTLGDCLVALVRDVRASLPHENLCLGGGLFYNTYLNTTIVSSGLYERVFVAQNPGNPGVAAGAALAVAREDHQLPVPPSPFLGPEYSPEAIKRVLDNCKLTYEYLSEGQLIDATVSALCKGSLVGWFQGRMEWGHRSLGNRSILANPFLPHVLDNLNVFLKQRERYRAYGLSICEEDAPRHFSVPAPSRFMELEYAPLDRDGFQHVLPEGAATLRVQTIDDEPSRFRELHRGFGAAAGAGVLVNTSFNGFHEPIVCSPRDAVRVFYGTGLDMLVLGQFVLRK